MTARTTGRAHQATVRVRDTVNCSTGAIVPSYRAYCPTCGRVGVPQDIHADASAIAARHYEAGGFDHRSATP